jgi:hypothetical protein
MIACQNFTKPIDLAAELDEARFRSCFHGFQFGFDLFAVHGVNPAAG